MKQIILASTSPRRKELMEKLGLPLGILADDLKKFGITVL